MLTPSLTRDRTFGFKAILNTRVQEQLYIVDEHGHLICLHLYTLKIETLVKFPDVPGVFDTILYNLPYLYCTISEDLFQFNISEKKLKKLKITNAYIRHSIVYQHYLLLNCFVEESSHVALYDPNQDKILWKMRTNESFQYAYNLDGKFIFSLSSGDVFCLDPSTCSLVWHASVPEDILYLSPFSDNILACMTSEREILLIDCRNGVFSTLFKIPDQDVQICMQTHNDRLYVLTRSHMYSWSTKSPADFRVQAHTSPSFGTSPFFQLSELQFTDTHAFFLDCHTPTLYALNLSTGELDWTEALPAQFSAAMSPGIVGDRLYLVDMEGGLHVWEGINQ